MSLRRLLALGSAAAAGALAGCGTSPPTRFFTLDAVSPAAVVPAPAAIAPVRVEAVHLPPGLDRPELIRRTGPDEVEVDDFARWSAPLGETARRTLTQDLAARLPPGAVLYPDTPRPAGARGLMVDVLAFGEDGGRAVLDVSWSLVAGRGEEGGGMALGGQAAPPRAYRLATPSAGPSSQASAADLSALLGLLADRIAADLAAGAR